MKEPSGLKIILITGPKYSGKTTVGLALAELLRAGFVDLDRLVETQTGKSPRTLFKEGPGVFRQAETRALASLLAGAALGSGQTQAGATVLVAAAGGGLVDNPGAMELLGQPAGGAATMVYLEVSEDTAWERIHREALESGEWPAFLQVEDPRETNAALHARRGRAYREMAAFTVNGEGKSPSAIAGEIALRLAPAAPRSQSPAPNTMASDPPPAKPPGPTSPVPNSSVPNPLIQKKSRESVHD
jgi:shikimate kinase